jgi:hypothetical protein
MNRDNFYCYRHILAIDPAYSIQNGTGYAIFDHQTYKLKKCGIVRLFAEGVDTYESIVEITKKIRLVWEKEVGFSYDPKILCIESPRSCFVRRGVRVNVNSIIMLAVLCTKIEGLFNPEALLRPAPRPINKEQTKEKVLNRLGAWDKNTLLKDIENIPQKLHHNVFDAIGLGLWAIDQKKNLSTKPQKNGRNRLVLAA